MSSIRLVKTRLVVLNKFELQLANTRLMSRHELDSLDSIAKKFLIISH